jgi:hypothetical protein
MNAIRHRARRAGFGILKVVTRLAVALLALLIAVAAPARTWCEASCLAAPPASDSAKPHCPTHESSNEGPAISAADNSECSTIDAARPVPATPAAWQPALSSIAPDISAFSAPVLRLSAPQAQKRSIVLPLRI